MSKKLGDPATEFGRMGQTKVLEKNSILGVRRISHRYLTRGLFIGEKALKKDKRLLTESEEGRSAQLERKPRHYFAPRKKDKRWKKIKNLTPRRGS